VKVFNKSFDELIGFSLAEVVITLIVIGGLSAISVPLYEHNIAQAKLSEADAALGSIRTQLRIYSSEHGQFPTVNPAGYVMGADWNDLERVDMVGKYFSDSSYRYLCEDGSSFVISCVSDSDPNSVRSLNQVGILSGDI